MNSWIYALLTVSIPLFLFLYFKKRTDTPRAGLIGVITYLLTGLVMIALGWNISPWVIVLPGIFVIALNVFQLRWGS